MIKLKARIVQRRATASDWTTANPTLLPGEFGYELDTHKLKVGALIGDEPGAWNDLPYFYGGATLPSPAGGSEGQVLVIHNGDWDIGNSGAVPTDIDLDTIQSTDYDAGSDLYYADNGTLISLTGDGYIRATNFAIDDQGNLYLKGTVASAGAYTGDGVNGFTTDEEAITGLYTSGLDVYKIVINSDGTITARPAEFVVGVGFNSSTLKNGVLRVATYDDVADKYARIEVDSQTGALVFSKQGTGAISTDQDVEEFALNGQNGVALGAISINAAQTGLETSGVWTFGADTYLAGHTSETLYAWLTRIENSGYTLPTASASTKGGVKIQTTSGLLMTGENLSVNTGSGLVNDNGTIKVDTSTIASQSWTTTNFAPASHSHAWSAITSKPFSTLGSGLSVVNDELIADTAIYTAGYGLTLVGTQFRHANGSIIPITSQGIYPITVDSYGHITSYGSAVTIPAAPGTLNTTNTTAQTTVASESLSGIINLHKVSKTGDYGDLLNKPTLGTAAAKDTTNLYSATGTDPITGTGVAAALATLPTPMQFQGTVGTGGTIEWSALPSASSSNNGYTYKVITDHSSAPVCKAGDTIISNGTTWVVIPSGDEPAGTVTSVGIANGGGLSVSGSPITSSGTITLSHADTSSQTSVTNTGRTYIQSITLDTYGHITALSSATETASGAGTLDTTNTSALATNASEALSGAVSLHKIAKTGTYSDLIGKPNPIAAGNGISIITNSGTGADDISILISSNDVGLAIDSTDHGLKADTTVLALKSELPTVNNATLIIQKNSTQVGTFTANASTDATIDISVPTKVSDLVNDSGFITGVAWADVTSKPFASLGDGLTVTSTVLKVNLGSDLKFDSSNPKKITHTNSVTAQTTQAIYPIKIDAQGHISAYGTAVTIPTVNNATLTIQRNSTSVGTFTANASTDVTLDISVPTTTSELTNDAGFITGVTWTDVTSKPFASLGDGLTTASSTLKVNLGSDLKFDSSSPKKITHTNSVTAQTTQALYPIKIDAQGHISAYGTAVTIPTIPGADRGLSLVSDKYGHSNATITAVTTQGLYKLAFDTYGHITGYTAYTDKNIYHKTGSWNDLTYTATKVGSTSSSDDLAFTIPTGTTATTVALGNHTHSLTLATDTGTSTITLASGGKYKLTAGGSTLIFTMPTDSGNTATAADNILDGSNSGTEITYAPYSSQQSRLSFDTSTTAPTRTDRLNLNGYLYATKLYSGGTEVSVSGHSHAWSAITSKPFSTVGSGLTVSSDALAVDFTAVATADHTHTTTLASDSGTSTVNLAANTTYKLTAGSTNVIFKTPADTNTATAADNILDGSNSGTQITYQPYSATTATSTWVGTDGNAGKLYLGTQAPSKTTRLNYNGYFYAKKLYSDGAEVLTSVAWDDVGSKPFASVGEGLTVASTVLKVNLGSDLKFDSSSPKKITHNNVVTAQNTQAVYPIKIDAQGHISAYGTAVTIPTITLNGSATTSPSFYAPAGAGTSGQYLKSSGTGAPTWANFPTIPTITLNGSATTSPSFYAPTGAGTSGQYLASSGTGAPTWTNFPTIPTIPGADRGISLVSNKYGHSNTAITAVTTQGLYKIAMDAYGHITGYTAYTDANSYHTSGSWNGLTYTATAVGGAGELALTLPTGTTATTVAVGNHTHTTALASDSGTSTVSLTYGGKFKLTAGGTSVIFTMPASDNTDTKQNVTLATTSKAFLTGVTTTPTSTAQALTGVADTGVYLTTTAGEFSAVRHSFNVSGTEKAYMAYNATTDAIDFIFV